MKQARMNDRHGSQPRSDSTLKPSLIVNCPVGPTELKGQMDEHIVSDNLETFKAQR